jgi:hypothetical protein
MGWLRRKPLSIGSWRRRGGAAREGTGHGSSLYLRDFGARRLSDRQAHHGLHDLGQPTIPSTGGHGRARREDLVRDFIIAASKTYGDAISNNEPKMPEIVDLYAMVNRLRVLGMTKTTACADIVMHTIVDAYFTPSRTVADLRELVRTGQGIDPLKDLSAAAREELQAFALL